MTKPVLRTAEKCLVCGHYHGGHGGCIIAHAFVKPEDCATCVRMQKAAKKSPQGPDAGGARS